MGVGVPQSHPHVTSMNPLIPGFSYNDLTVLTGMVEIELDCFQMMSRCSPKVVFSALWIMDIYMDNYGNLLRMIQVKLLKLVNVV
jgi:hypothetical protein